MRVCNVGCSIILVQLIELITRTLRTIYVEREDPESRMKAAEEIRRRTHTRGEWPKVLIFPEGKFYMTLYKENECGP